MWLLIVALLSASERDYYAGRFDQAIANADDARKAKYMAMRTFVMGGDFSEAIATAERAYSAANDAATRAEALTWEGFARYAQAMTSGSNDYQSATERTNRALELRRQSGDARGIAEATFYRGLIAERTGDPAAALELYNEALEIAQRGGFALEESYALRHIGFIEQGRGDLISARKSLQRSFEIRERIGFNVFLPFSILSLAEIDTSLGRFDEAEKEFTRARAVARELGFRRLEVLVDLSWSELMVRRALRTSEEIGYPRGVDIARKRLER
jgi:tetratricopeptide (TPR) repeat protein